MDSVKKTGEVQRSGSLLAQRVGIIIQIKTRYSCIFKSEW